ncbi:MAG: hypothetical protein PUD02_03330, partial [Eggerthellales bacterium]|nr:hypothetical protein [Eggerthellales bacterium]
MEALVGLSGPSGVIGLCGPLDESDEVDGLDVSLEGFPEQVEAFLAEALRAQALAADISRGLQARIEVVNGWAAKAATRG